MAQKQIVSFQLNGKEVDVAVERMFRAMMGFLPSG